MEGVRIGVVRGCLVLLEYGSRLLFYMMLDDCDTLGFLTCGQALD